MQKQNIFVDQLKQVLTSVSNRTHVQVETDKTPWSIRRDKETIEVSPLVHRRAKRSKSRTCKGKHGKKEKRCKKKGQN